MAEKKVNRRLTPTDDDSGEEVVKPVVAVKAKVAEIRTEADEDGEGAEEGAAPSGALLQGVGIVVPTAESAAAEALTRPTDPNEIVGVTFIKPVDHPITVGSFKSIDYGLTSFPAGARASIPWCAAEVLLDRKIVVLV